MKAVAIKKRKTYRTFDELRSEFKNIYSFQILSMMSHSYVLERQKEIFDTDDYKRLKVWQRAYIEGIRDAQLQATYLHLQWSFIYNGVYMEKLPYGPDFDQNLVEDSFHHYKGHPERRF